MPFGHHFELETPVRSRILYVDANHQTCNLYTRLLRPTRKHVSAGSLPEMREGPYLLLIRLCLCEVCVPLRFKIGVYSKSALAVNLSFVKTVFVGVPVLLLVVLDVIPDRELPSSWPLKFDGVHFNAIRLFCADLGSGKLNPNANVKSASGGGVSDPSKDVKT